MSKKILLTAWLSITTCFVFSQTNTIQSSGNVGIGTTTPSSPLQIGDGTSTGNGGTVLLKGYYNGSATSMFITPDGSNPIISCVGGNALVIQNNSGVQFETVNSASQFAYFHPNGGLGLGSYASYPTTNSIPASGLILPGNVGIGITTPSHKLEIQTRVGAVNDGIGLTEASGSLRATMSVNTNTEDLLVASTQALRFYTGSIIGDIATLPTNERLTILNNGNVGIGTMTPDAKLDVNGTTYSRKVFIGLPDANTVSNMGSNNLLAVNGTAVFVKAKVAVYGLTWPDYVFTPNYKLTSLDSLEQFIQLNNHLPEVPTANEVQKNGVDLGENQALLLKKIEELTLIVIELNKEMELKNKKIQQLELMSLRVSAIEEEIKKMKEQKLQ